MPLLWRSQQAKHIQLLLEAAVLAVLAHRQQKDQTAVILNFHLFHQLVEVVVVQVYRETGTDYLVVQVVAVLPRLAALV